MVVFFLWHFPSGHPAWLLASILPYGARTFLPQPKLPVIICLSQKKRLTDIAIFNAGGFTSQFAQIVQFGAAHFTMAYHIDLSYSWRM